jgi:GTP pyrophosphokinase
VKPTESIASTLTEWRNSPRGAQLPAELLAWAERGHAPLPAELATETLGTLQVLAELRADVETQAAAALFLPVARGQALPPALLSPVLTTLLDGQREAEKVWSLHAQSGTAGARNNAEGLAAPACWRSSGICASC